MKWRWRATSFQGQQTLNRLGQQRQQQRHRQGQRQQKRFGFDRQRPIQRQSGGERFYSQWRAPGRYPNASHRLAMCGRQHPGYQKAGKAIHTLAARHMDTFCPHPPVTPAALRARWTAGHGSGRARLAPVVVLRPWLRRQPVESATARFLLSSQLIATVPKKLACAQRGASQASRCAV